MDAKTQTEYDRIASGPHKGWFTFVHHDSSVIEHSNDIVERIQYIVQEKAVQEIYTRLRHIYFVDPALGKDYQAKRKLLDEDYQAKSKPLYEDYQAKCKLLDEKITKVVPNCAWNGKTILK